MINKDKLNSIAASQLATDTFNVLDRLQQLEAHSQPLALSTLFILVCERYKQDPKELLAKSERIMRDTTDNQYWLPEFRAIREYMEKEI